MYSVVSIKYWIHWYKYDAKLTVKYSNKQKINWQTENKCIVYFSQNKTSFMVKP